MDGSCYASQGILLEPHVDPRRSILTVLLYFIYGYVEWQRGIRHEVVQVRS